MFPQSESSCSIRIFIALFLSVVSMGEELIPTGRLPAVRRFRVRLAGLDAAGIVPWSDMI